MEIVSIINYKGGVGKTTVTANIAAYLASRGKKVLLLDMDAQSSLSFSFVTPDYWDSNLKDTHTIKKWFDGISQNGQTIPLKHIIIQPSDVNSFLKNHNSNGIISLISSHLGLINVDLELATLLSSSSMQQAKKKYIQVHGNLRKELKVISQEDYDIVLIDCPPNFNIVTKNALIASDKILVPAKPDYLSTLGIDYLQRSVKDLIKDYNEYADGLDNEEKIHPEIMGVVFTMIQLYGGAPIQSQQQYIAQTKRLGVPVFTEYTINNNTIYADAPQSCIPIVLNDYSQGTYSSNVLQLKKLGNEFMNKVGL